MAEAATPDIAGALPELAECDAVGDVAAIYREIRESCAVPYVSSLQRHLATRRGWLEWSWAAVRPAFMDGSAQNAAWEAVAGIDTEPLPPLTRHAMRVFGVDEAGEAAIRAICDTFVRASPTNLMLSGLLRRLLDGHRPGAMTRADATEWTPPAALPGLPPLVRPEQLSIDARCVLMQFGAEVGGHQFVPGLYRMLAQWPLYMTHLATVMRPRFADAETRRCCASVLERIDATVHDVFAQLPALSEDGAIMTCSREIPMPPPGEFADVLTALDRYRQTSPEMIVFGTLIRDALPDNENMETPS